MEQTMDAKIRKILEELRSSLQADGGDLDIVSIQGTQVQLKLKGACGCCPHAQMTLKNGIERILRENKIEIPFPQRDVHIRSASNVNAAGDAPQPGPAIDHDRSQG